MVRQHVATDAVRELTRKLVQVVDDFAHESDGICGETVAEALRAVEREWFDVSEEE